MKTRSEITRLNALAFLYDHLSDFPVWIRKLTRGQLENIARIMIEWPAVLEGSTEIVPMEEIEKREVIRAIRLCGGDADKAAKALKMGRTTVYHKLKQWGYTAENRLVTQQASILAKIREKERAISWSTAGFDAENARSSTLKPATNEDKGAPKLDDGWCERKGSGLGIS